MNERRMSLGNRVISLVLALVMVFGMLPTGLFAFTAKAAETTTDVSETQANIAKIEDYAQMMLNENFTVYTKPSWATESSTSWKYYNGVMIRALMMMGVNSDSDVTNSTGNALEYLSGFMNEDIVEGTEKPADYSDDELDSVPPARMLFYLLGTTEDQDKYEASIHYVYDALADIVENNSYQYNGGNLLHKNDWKDGWQIGLDGIYMAQPFLLEYANAIDKGIIENKYSVDTTDLRTQVYTRLIWIADNMATKVATVDDVDYYLYNHGCKARSSEDADLVVNCQYWGRGIGWYAAGLVDCIELMPTGDQKNELIKRLPKLFDGMIYYQDGSGGAINTGNNTGMWYNLVNGVKYEGSKTSNDLETSGTALMAYALLKAYNNSWVTADTYKNAGLRAFNGIVNNKVTGSAGSYVIGGIYQQSGVSDTASDYGTYAYEDHEAKGTGPVIMAAVEAKRTIGTAEANVIGVVSAPSNLVIPVNSTLSNVDLSNVKLTLVSNRGRVTTTAGNELDTSKWTITDTSSSGTATVTVKSGDIVIDTFTVKVVDPEDPIAANGIITDSNSSNIVYVLDTDGVTSAGTYIIVAQNDGKYYAFSNDTSKPSSNTTGYCTEVTYDSDKNTVSFGDTTSASLSEWAFSASSYTASDNGYVNFTVKNTYYSDKTMYIRTSDNEKPLYSGGGKTFYLKHIGNGVYRAAKEDAADTETNRELIFNGSAWTMSAELTSVTNTVMLFRKVNGHTVNLTIKPNTVNVGVDETYDLTSEGTTVTVDGEEVTLAGCTISWASSDESVATVENGTITGKANGTATVTATLSKAPVDGTATALDSDISVNITVNVSTTCEHTPDGDGVVSSPTCEAQGYTTYTCSKCGSSYNTDYVDATGHSWGEGVVTEPTCTAGGYTTYTCSNCSDTKTDNETEASGHSYVSGVCSACGAVDSGYVAPGIESITAPNNTTGKATIQVDGTLQLTANTVGGATISWTSSNPEIAQITSTTTGENQSVATITGKASGKVTITATVVTASRAVGDSATFEVTVYEGSTVTGDWELIAQTAIEATSHIASNDISTEWQKSKNATGSDNVSGNTYKLVTGTLGDLNGRSFIIVNNRADGSSTTGTALQNNLSGDYGKGTAYSITINADNTITLDDASKFLCTFAASGDGYLVTNNGYYLRQNGNIFNKSNSSVGAIVDFNTSTGACLYALEKDTSSRFLMIDGSTWTRSDSKDKATTIYLYEKQSSGDGSATSTPAEYAQLQGSGTFTYNAGEKTADEVIAAIKAAYDVYMGTSSDGTGAEAQLDSTATWEWLDTYDANTAGTYRVQVTYGDNEVVLGTITVAVNAQASTTDTKWAQMTGESITVTAGAVTDDELLAMVTDAISIQQSEQATDHTDATNYTGTAYTLTWANDTEPDADTAGEYTATVTVPFVITTNGTAANRETPATLGTVTVTVVAAVECEHSYNTEVTDPTCTEQGYTTYICSKCNDTYVADYVDAKGHTEVTDAAVAATCTTTGLTEGKHCSVCNTVIVAQTVTEKLGHSYSASVTTAPGCETTGVRTYTCSRCAEGTEGHSYTEEIAATGHSWNSGEVTKEATCYTAGVKTFTCQNDTTHTYTETIAATGNHTYGDDGNCTTDGCGATKPNTNVTVTAGKTPSETQFVVATELKEGQLYVIANADSSGTGFTHRAAYWNENQSSWTSQFNGGDDEDPVLEIPGDGESVYTLIDGKKVSLWYWDADKSSFYLSTDSSKYLNCEDSSGAVATLGTSSTEYTVDLTGKTITIKGSDTNYKYLKIEKNGTLNAKNSGNTWLLTPVMTGSDVETKYLVEISVADQTVEVGKSVTPTVTITVKDENGNTVSTTATGTFEFASADTAKATGGSSLTGVAATDTPVSVTVTLDTLTIGGVTATIDTAGSITATFNLTVTEATVIPATDKYVIPTQMETGKQYLFNNSSSSKRAALWDGDSWETGTVTVTSSDGIYTITPSTAYTLVTWEAKDSSTTEGYFYFTDSNGTVQYLSGVDSVTSSKSEAELFTVDLENLTVKCGSKYFKLESSGGFSSNNSEQKSMRLFTPTTVTDDSGDDDTGSDTPVVGSQYVHNFTEHGKTSDFYTISGNLSTSKGSTTYNGLTLTQCLKMESSTSITFTAPAEGTLTLVLGESNSAVKVNGKSYTSDSNGVVTVPVSAGAVTVAKGDTNNLFYMAYAPTVAQNSITVTGEETLYIGGVDEDDLTIEVVYGGKALESGYELTVKSNDETVVKVENTDGKYCIVAQKAGLATITAALTKVGDTDVTAEAITDTLTVAVLEPSIQLDDDLVMVEGQSYTFTPSVAYEDTDISDYEIKLTVADGGNTDAVTATLNDDGTITLKAVKATADETYVTVTATLTRIGENTVTGYSDSMQVEVAAKTIVKVDMAPSTITMGNDESLTDLQNYEKDVTLTFHYNDGTSVTKTVADGITINNNNVTIGTVGTYYAPVTYVDAEMGVNYAKDLVVTILDATQINAEGVAAEVEVSYVLDTDGTIEGDSKYLIVVGTNALMVNPNADGNHAGISNTDVTISDDGTIATVGSNAILTEWHFAGRGESGNNQTYTLVSNKDANGETTYMLRSDSKFLGTSKSSTITLEPVDASKGQYVIRLASGRYLMCNSSGTWSRSDSSTEASEATTVTLYKRTETPKDTHTVAFELEGTGVACNLGVHTLPTALGVGLSKTFTGSVKLDGVAIDLSRCEIEWSVEDTDYLSVNGGTVTGVKDSGDTSYKVYAKLISVDGMTITAQDNSAYLLETVVIKVADVDITYQLVINGEETDTMYLPLGEQPDLTQVQVKVYQTIDDVTSYVETYDYEDLIFNVADSELDVDAPGSSASIAVLNRDSEKEIATLTIKVGSNATQYRETAEEYAGYPDDGAVRLDKVATGVNFMQTGIAKIQLMVAGVSTNTPVDVVLIVDVSNSMGWDINRSSGSNDQAKIPTDGADGTDKLDNAMSAASDFADILLKNNVSGSASNNTISFVTFAGNDTDRAGADADCLDAMQTVFVGSDDLTTVKTAFEGTKFTQFDNQSNGKVKYTLQINGGTAKENAGGTNYDYAFLQGQDAVTKLKAQWSEANGNKSYDESGRELHVIFMTDGIPSHYNGYCYETGSQTSGFTEFSGKDAAWLAEVQKVNQNATDLYAMVTDIHTVGFDLDAGGIGDEADAIRLLSGLVENRKLECALAEESATLTQFFTQLAESLAFAGTSAIAVDGVSTDFELWTKPIDVNVDNDTTDAEDIEPTIEILSRRLVLYSDIGSTLNIINEKGETVSVKLDADNIATYLGAYVDEEAQVIEKVEFGTDTDNNTAYSSLLDGDIWDDTTNTITGKYFTYDVAKKEFTWNISDITDREISLNYYGYLVGSGKQSGDTVKDFTDTLIATNSEATISYVDIDGKIANRTFPVPYMSFGKALVTFRFYIVNEDGLFVNNADVTFDSPANRIFLSERATYQLDVGDTNIATEITAKAALETAKITGKPLYDDAMAVTVTPGAGGSVVWTINTELNNYPNLQIYQDLSGDYTDIVIDIPVVGTLGNADSKMFDSNVVIDFSNPVQWDARAAAEAAYDGVAVDNQISTIELVGFAEYDANADLTAYLAEKTWATSITTAYGTYEVVTGTDEIKFTPSAMLNGADHVFAVFKFSTQNAEATDATMDYHYLYKHVTVVPASVMYYETSGNMAGAFTYTKGETEWEEVTDSSYVDPVTIKLTDADKDGYFDSDGYGYDASYSGWLNYAGGSAMRVINANATGVMPSVTFTFTGTGIDIISRTGKTQGLIKMTLTGKNTGTVRNVIVLNKGTDNLYQIPVLSVEDLPYDTYSVKIIVYAGCKAYGGEFNFDAVKIYGGCLETEVVGYKTNADGTKSNVTVGDLYAEAGESSPQILEIRDILLSSNDFGSVTLDDTTINGAVYIDGNLTMGEGSSNFNDYDKIGPNNEVYLSKGQAIAFKLKVADTAKLPKTLAIGLKSVNTAVDAEIIIVAADGTQTTYTYSSDSAIKTSTAMFYDLLGGEDAEAFLKNSSGFTVVIRNIDNSDAILSVTDLKIAYGETVGSVETVVDSGLETDALNALTATANVASVTCNNVVTTVVDNVEVTKNVAYAMQTTTLVVVTGQAAQSIQIMEGETEIAATATFVDTEDGARVWRVLVRMTEVGEHTLTVFGVNSSGNVGEISQTITLDVQLFQSASTSEQTAD